MTPEPEEGCIVSYDGSRYEIVDAGDEGVGSYVRATGMDGSILFPRSELAADGDVWLIA